MWFNSNYYQLLYQHRSDSEAQLFINNLSEYAQFDHLQPAKSLDLGCGQGRHALYLGTKFPFLQVLGLDLAPDCIAQAQAQAEKLNLKNCQFAVQDILAPLDKYGEFGLILNLFTSFGYFDRDELQLLVLKNVAAALSPKGVFVLDYMNVDRVIPNLVKVETQEISGIHFHIERKIEEDFIRKYVHVQDPAQPEPQEFSEQVKIYRLADFEQLFADAGLKIRAVFGDYQLNEFDSVKSPRLILLAQR